MDSNRTPPYPNPTSPELLNRRARRVKQLARIYRDHYWALMEELKLKHREYYWEYGKSPFVEDEENENHLNSSLAAENGNGNLGVNGGNSASNGAIRCGVNGCKAKALALSKFCLMHILHDSKQRLYKSCTFTIKRYATLCIRENPGCLFIATNRDAVTHLTDAQEWTGGGSMVGAVGGSTQREPPVVGKPSTFMNHDGLFSRQICMVGDRLDTDILFGQNGGCMTLLVLSGVTSISMLQNPDNTIQPDFYTNKISDFLSLKAATV